MEVEGHVTRVEQVRSGERRDGFSILSNKSILRENDMSN